MAEKHEAEVIEKKAHKSVGSFENGQCLSPHQYPYKERDSCSYRWQGLKKARDNKHIYNAHKGFSGKAPKNYHIDQYNEVDYGVGNAAGKIAAVLKTFSIKATKKKTGEEYLKKMQTVSAMNFTNGKLPYHNQVHHVLPCAELRDGLDKKVKDSRTIQHICNKLLETKYNLNRHINMIILPKTKGHGYQVGLPIHPNNHPGYSEKIRQLVKKALAKVQKSKDDGEDHEKLDYPNIKKNLEEISDEMYKVLAKPGIMDRQSIYGNINSVPDIKDWKTFPKMVFN